MIALSSRTARLTAVALGLLMLSVGASAQQSMSVDELEAYIEKKKDELNAAVEQREETAMKQEALEEKRAEQLARQERIEQELRKLCDEREEAKPGSKAACLQEMKLAVYRAVECARSTVRKARVRPR